MRRFPAFRLCAAVLLSLCCAPLVHAGTYPDHPIKMLTMTKPGAQIDLLTRAVAEKLKASLGQPVLVSNVPGGSHGSVMATELASSPADGYTLGVSATAAFTYSPHFVRTKYGLGDFQFLTLLGLGRAALSWRKAEKSGGDGQTAVRWRHLACFLIPCALLMPAMSLFGFLPAGIAFMVVIQIGCGQRRWFPMTLVSVAPVLLVYAIMRFGLGVPMP